MTRGANVHVIEDHDAGGAAGIGARAQSHQLAGAVNSAARGAVSVVAPSHRQSCEAVVTPPVGRVRWW